MDLFASILSQSSYLLILLTLFFHGAVVCLFVMNKSLSVISFMHLVLVDVSEKVSPYLRSYRFSSMSSSRGFIRGIFFFLKNETL